MPPQIERQFLYTIAIENDLHDVTGRKFTKKGYVTLCVKTHPQCGEDGYVFEHRIVAEMTLGRYLNPGEIVHHINGRKSKLEMTAFITSGYTVKGIMRILGISQSMFYKAIDELGLREFYNEQRGRKKNNA